MYRIDDWNLIERFYYRAMLDGWASGSGEFSQILALPGHHLFQKRQDDLLLVDMWTHTPMSPRSAGTTTIYKRFDVDDVPIWQMHYWGEYEKAEREFLKFCVRVGYQILLEEMQNRRNPFNGCRGANLHKEDDGERVYINDPPHGATFRRFTGSEMILRDMHADPQRPKDEEILGWHDYAGMALVPDSK